jgi:endonuclease/exonuclease/phosphatase family metal-dependent hydrolase
MVSPAAGIEVEPMRTVSTVALLAVFSSIALQAGAHAERALKLMSFNVRYGTADDGPDHWDLRRGFLVETIRAADPDVLGVQECLEFQAEYIAAGLEGYHWIGMGRDFDGSGEMTAVFYKKETLAPLDFEHFWLSEAPDSPGSKSWDTALTRMATRVRFLHRQEKKSFTVFNTHFDHKGVVAREQSAVLMATRAQGLPGDHPVVVIGDFNSFAEDSAPWQTFIDAGFQDSWLAAPEKIGPETTWSGFGKNQQLAGPHRIDWILFRGPVVALRTEIVTTNKDGRYPSDHFPVTAQLQLWPASPAK